MKKLLSTLLLLLLLVLVNEPAEAADKVKMVNHNNITITEMVYDRLIDLGFSHVEISHMDKEEFNMNKDLIGKVISSSTKYYKIVEVAEQSPQEYLLKDSKLGNESVELIASETTRQIELTKEEYYRQVNEVKAKLKLTESTRNSSMTNRNSMNTSNSSMEPSSSSRGPSYSSVDMEPGGGSGDVSSSPDSNSYKTMTTEIISMGSREYRVKNSVNWDVIPGTRSYDVIGVAINSSAFRPMNNRDYYGRQNWTLHNSRFNDYKYDGANYTTASSKWSMGAEGYGVKMNLKNDEPADMGMSYNVVELSMYAYYQVNEMTYGSQTYLDAYGRYGHADVSVTPSFGFGLSVTGPSISFSGTASTNFTIQDNTHATATLY